MDVMSLAAKISLDSHGFTSALGKSLSAFKSFGTKIGSMAKNVGKVAAAGLAVIGGSMTAIGASAVKEGLTFDKAMSQVAATLGKTTEDIKELSDFARKMGAETAFSATEAAEALNYMALAGYDSEKSMRMLPTVLNLAAAGNMDLARASDMVTDAQSALGLSLEESEALVDQMAKTSSKTNTSVEQLGDAMLTVGGTAKMMKGGTAELNAVLGVLADNGIKGSEGGTALRNVMLALSSPTKKAATALKQLGVNVYDAEGNMKDIPTIMAELNAAMSGMSQQERTKYISQIFNKRDLKSVEALLGTTSDRWAELNDEIANSGGAAAQMAETQLDNLAGDITKLKSAASEAKLKISDMITPKARRLIQNLTTLVQRVSTAFGERGLTGAIHEAKYAIREMIADFLGLDKGSSWNKVGRTIGKKFINGIKNLFKNTKESLRNLLWLGNDASWADIGKKIIKKIKRNARIGIAQLLNMDHPYGTTWGEIGKKILDGLTSYFKNGGSFLKKLILGKGYSDKATWMDVGVKISQWISNAFSSNGLITQFLKNLLSKAQMFAQIAGQFIKGIAEWVSKPESIAIIVDIIKNFINALVEAAPHIIQALIKIVTDPQIWDAILKLLSALGEALVDGIFGKGTVKSIRKALGIRTQGEITGVDIMDMYTKWGMKFSQWKLYEAKGDTEKQNKLEAEWNDYIQGVFNKIGYDPSYYNDWIDMFGFDEMKQAFEDVGGDQKKFVEVFGKSITDFQASVDKFGKDVNDDGSHAKGLYTVPFDDYKARLHRGEMVLTKSQARKYREGAGGGFNMTGLKEDIVGAIQSGMASAYVNAIFNDRQVGTSANRYTGYKMDAGRFRR